MNNVDHAGETRNTRKPSIAPAKSETVAILPSKSELSRGGSVIQRRRPLWSASLCNAVAGLAGIGQEVRHVG